MFYCNGGRCRVLLVFFKFFQRSIFGAMVWWFRAQRCFQSCRVHPQPQAGSSGGSGGCIACNYFGSALAAGRCVFSLKSRKFQILVFVVLWLFCMFLTIGIVFFVDFWLWRKLSRYCVAFWILRILVEIFKNLYFHRFAIVFCDFFLWDRIF